MISRCPICKASSVEPVWRVAQRPIHNLIRVDEPLRPEQFAMFDVVRCTACGHGYNRAYDCALADRMYRGDVLSNVPVHVSMSRGLEEIAAWIEPPQIAGKRVVEIGAGSGHLARLLAQTARTVQIFEPCRGLSAEMVPEPNITLVNEAFTASLVEDPVDLVVCRQVLEHLADPLALLRQIRAVLSPTGSLYLEVPRAEYIEEHAALFDLHFLHVQYFTEANLIHLAARAGFSAQRAWHLKQSHDIGVLFRPQPGRLIVSHPPSDSWVSDLPRRLEERWEHDRAWLVSLEGSIALYGATSQGQAFLNAFPSNARLIAAADDNPDYAGYALYTQERRVPVVSPTDETLQGCDQVIITAYLHDTVIAERLRQTGFSGRIFSIRQSEPVLSGSRR